MSERPDNTTEPDTESPPERERQPRNYYYDDGTGYELYNPEDDPETNDPEHGDT